MGKHFDAPTGRGYHPHAVRPGEERRGEHSGYQTRSSVSGTDVQDTLIRGQSTPGAPFGTVQPQSMLDWAAQHPLLVAGILLGGAVLIANSAGARSNPRRNPDEDPPARGAMLLSHPLTLYPDCMTPTAVARTPRGGDPNKLEDYLPAERAPQAHSSSKTKRTRRTSQARDAKGHYLTAGTRKKVVTEGK